MDYKGYCMKFSPDIINDKNTLLPGSINLSNLKKDNLELYIEAYFHKKLDRYPIIINTLQSVSNFYI